MIALQDILSQEIVQKLGWTLLHFIWQAAVLAIFLAILLRILRKSTANLRYIIACLALALILLLPVITIQLIPISVPQMATHIEPAPAPVVLATEEIPIAETIVLEERVQAESVTPVYSVSWKQRTIDALEPALPYIVSGWLFGVFGLSVWHLGGWAQLQRLKRRMVKQVDDTLHSKLKVLAQRLRVKQTVPLMESALVQIPTVVGWLRPVILLPASALTGLTSEQLEAILAHELAHIKRFDYLLNMLQTVVEILGFYHPAVWWVSHKIRAERENCCDDLAVAVSGDRVCYARALTSMEEIRAGRGQLAVAATGGNLFRRIRRLVSKDSTEKTSFSWIPAVTVLLLIIALLIPTALALTAKSNPQQAVPKSNVPIEDKKTESAVKLKLLGLAVAMYADDHDDTLPDSLQKLKPYIRNEQDFNWLLDNIKYLGSGKSAQRNAVHIPIAYDRELLEEANGTNILFLDFSVRFLETKEFEKLDIRRAEFLIEAWFLAVNKDFIENINHNADSTDEAKELFKLKSELLAAVDGSETQSFILDENNVSLLLKAVRAHKDSKVLASPQVICQEDKTAQIKVLNNETYYMRSYFEPNRPSEKSEPKVEKIEEGITISLKPKLTPNKNIDMQLELEITQIPGFEERKFKGKAPYKPPRLQSIAQSTRYIAKDGQTLLFGGHKIVDQQDGRTEQKDLLVLIKAQTIDSSEQDKSAKAENLIVTEPPRITIDGITQPAVAKSRTERRKDNEQEKTKATSEQQPQMVQKFFPLQHQDASKMAQILKPLLSHTGHISTDERTNSLLVIDTVENLLRIEKIIAEFDVSEAEQTVTEIFEIRHSDPAEIVKSLRMLITGQPGFGAIIEPGKQPVVLIPEPRRKWIIAKAFAEDMKQIGEWIARLDREEPAKKDYEVVLIRYTDVTELADRLNESIQKIPGLESQADILLQPLEKTGQIIIFGKADKREMVKKLIEEIDIPSGDFETRVFKLKYADPNQIKENIDNLYSGTAPSGSARYYYYRYRRGSQPSDADTVKVISYPKLKQVTVIAAPHNMLKIAEQIKEWDVPLDVDKLKPRIIELQNSDAAQMAELLKTLFTKEGGGGLNILDILIDRGTELKQKNVGPPYEQLIFEEVPGTNKLIVISKIPEAYDVIEQLILDLDREEPAPASLEQIEQQIIKQQKILKMRQDCINNDPVVKALSENVAKTETELIVARQKFTPLHPEVRQKAEYLQVLKQHLDERITAVGKSFDDMMWPEPNLPPAPEVPLITNTWLENDMLEVLQDIASMAGIPIIPDETVVGLVTAELKDVPLDTALDIVLAGTPYVVKKTPYYYLVASALEPPEIQKRVYSAKKLSNLGKALLIYANDHEDKYPDSLHHLSEYLNLGELKWVLANVKYLAHGKTIAVRPDTIIAYDKRLLAEGKGTNVLFNDSHVELVKPERLKELGISATAILIDTRLLSVSEDFLKDVGLDANSVSSSDAWSEHLLEDSAADPNTGTYNLLLDELHVSFLLRAIQAHKDAGVLTSPQVMCQEGKTAEIGILSEEYFVMGYTEPNDPSDEPETKLDKVELGTRIWLKPELTPDNQNVNLDFKLEISNLKGIIEGKYQGKYPYHKPIVDVISTETRTVVPNGKTLLIGGLKMTEQEKEPPAPRLGDLPLIGGLFSNNDKIKEPKMLLILVKPTITPQQKASKILPGQEDSEEHIKSLARQLYKKLNSPAD